MILTQKKVPGLIGVFCPPLPPALWRESKRGNILGTEIITILYWGLDALRALVLWSWISCYTKLPNSSKQTYIAFSQSNPWNIVVCSFSCCKYFLLLSFFIFLKVFCKYSVYIRKFCSSKTMCAVWRNGGHYTIQIEKTALYCAIFF